MPLNTETLHLLWEESVPQSSLFLIYHIRALALLLAVSMSACKAPSDKDNGPEVVSPIREVEAREILD